MNLYVDCQSGISGNMMIGALLDCGVPFEWLQGELDKLGLEGYSLLREKKAKLGVEGTYFNVQLQGQAHSSHHHHHHNHCYCEKTDSGEEAHHAHSHDHASELGPISPLEVKAGDEYQPGLDENGHHPLGGFVRRGFKEIEKLIQESTLPKAIQEKAIKAFKTLGLAEAKVHETTLEEVHFHEVGAVDCIVDIVGTMLCLDYLGVKAIHFSPLHVGRGKVYCDHGWMDIPTPATAILLDHMPTYTTEIVGELVTPTGATLVKTLATTVGLGEIPSAKLKGVGLGSMDLAIPNVLRIYEL